MTENQLSSNAFYYKFFFLWFGFLFIILILTILDGGKFYDIMPIILMLFFGYLFMKMTAVEYEIYDCGDHVIIKNSREEDTIPLTNITHINYSGLLAPTIIILTLKQPCKFGSKVRFLAPIGFPSKYKSTKDLAERINSLNKA